MAFKELTTSGIRDGEDPESYNFVLREEFEESIENGKLLEGQSSMEICTVPHFPRHLTGITSSLKLMFKGLKQ